MGKLIISAAIAILKAAQRVAKVAKKLKDKFKKEKPSCKEKCPRGGAAKNGPYANQTTEQLEKSSKSYKELIREHEKKLSDYRNDPFAHDNLGKLKNAPSEIQQKIIDGRIRELESQLAKQRGELGKIEKALRECPSS